MKIPATTASGFWFGLGLMGAVGVATSGAAVVGLKVIPWVTDKASSIFRRKKAA